MVPTPDKCALCDAPPTTAFVVRGEHVRPVKDADERARNHGQEHVHHLDGTAWPESTIFLCDDPRHAKGSGYPQGTIPHHIPGATPTHEGKTATARDVIALLNGEE